MDHQHRRGFHGQAPKPYLSVHACRFWRCPLASLRCGVESETTVVAPDRPAAQSQPNNSPINPSRSTGAKPTQVSPLDLCSHLFRSLALLQRLLSRRPSSFPFFLFTLFPSSLFSLKALSGISHRLPGSIICTKHHWNRQTTVKPGLPLAPLLVIFHPRRSPASWSSLRCHSRLFTSIYCYLATWLLLDILKEYHFAL